MPDFTIKNLDAIDNAIKDAGWGVDARFARKALDCEHLGVSRLRYAPGGRLPFGHSHGAQEEVYVVISGSARMKLDDEIVDIGPWDAIRVAPGVIRAIHAGPDGLELVVTGSDRPESGDNIGVKDWWTD